MRYLALQGEWWHQGSWWWRGGRQGNQNCRVTPGDLTAWGRT